MFPSKKEPLQWTFTVTLDTNGTYVKNGENFSIESTVEGAYLAEGISMDFAGELKLINDEVFLKLNTIPALGFDLSEVKDKWLQFDLSEDQEFAAAMTEAQQFNMGGELSEEMREKV